MKLVRTYLIPECFSRKCSTQVELDGLTGRIKFDHDGLRTEFELQIVELKKHGLEKVLHGEEMLLAVTAPFLRLGPGKNTLGSSSPGTSQRPTQKLWKVFRIKPW